MALSVLTVAQWKAIIVSHSTVNIAWWLNNLTQSQMDKISHLCPIVL